MSFRGRLAGRPVVLAWDRSPPSEEPGLDTARRGLDLYNGLATRQHRIQAVSPAPLSSNPGPPDHPHILLEGTDAPTLGDVLDATPPSGIPADVLGQVGLFLRRLHDENGVGQLDPALVRAFMAGRARLQSTPIIGGLLFRHHVETARELVDAASAGPFSPSLGPELNMRLRLVGNKARLDDPVLCRPAGHPLIDLYDLRIRLDAASSTAVHTEGVLSALTRGFGPRYFPPALHRLAYEISRTRWMVDQLDRGWRGIFIVLHGSFTFARPSVSALTVIPE